MSELSVTKLLAEMRAMAAQLQKPAAAEIQQSSAVDFGALLKQSISQVNEQQQNSTRMLEAFAVGKEDVDIAQVMLAMNKASLSFRAMAEVRNRLVSAYQEIMNMPI